MADTTELVPELLEAGVHFGHQTKRWNPKMRPYIFEQKNQIYIINLDETVRQLQRATQFLEEVTRRGGKILFVGCKKQAQQAVKEAALACGCPVGTIRSRVHRARESLAALLGMESAADFVVPSH